MENKKVIQREHKRLYDDGGVLLYEGETYKDFPYGHGIAYYPNGTIFREGEFGVKGFLGGKEYYSNGNLRFNGKMQCHRGYGPNYPLSGEYYSEDGTLVFKGKFQIKFGGVGWPMVVKPSSFNLADPPYAPHLSHIMWDDLRDDAD